MSHTCFTQLWVTYAGGERKAREQDWTVCKAVCSGLLSMCRYICLVYKWVLCVIFLKLNSLERSLYDVGLIPNLFWICCLRVNSCFCCITGKMCVLQRHRKKGSAKKRKIDWPFLFIGWRILSFGQAVGFESSVLASVGYVHWRADRDSSSDTLTGVDARESNPDTSVCLGWTMSQCDILYYANLPEDFN